MDLSGKSTLVLATLLKEYLRSLPDSLIPSELYEEIVSRKSGSEERANEIIRYTYSHINRTGLIGLSQATWTC